LNQTASSDAESYLCQALGRRWKGNEDGKRQQTLHFVRNKMNPDYCPVVQIMLWLKTLAENGIHKGPLFPFIDKRERERERERERNAFAC